MINSVIKTAFFIHNWFIDFDDQSNLKHDVELMIMIIRVGHLFFLVY